jgi:hypothetical protein
MEFMWNRRVPTGGGRSVVIANGQGLLIKPPLIDPDQYAALFRLWRHVVRSHPVLWKELIAE